VVCLGCFLVWLLKGRFPAGARDETELDCPPARCSVRPMKPIDIERELQDLVASEEVLAFFDVTVPLASGPIEGLCKVSRPRERRSRATYLSLMFVIDAPDQAVLRAIDEHMGAADWNACGSEIC